METLEMLVLNANEVSGNAGIGYVQQHWKYWQYLQLAENTLVLYYR